MGQIMDIKKTLTINQKLTFLILFFLLFTRIVSSQGITWLFSNIDPIWVIYYFNAAAYILTAVVIGLNKNNLESLHIDRPFISLFIGTGILLFIFYLPIQLGIFVGLTAIILFGMLYTRKFTFGATYLNYRQAFILFTLILIALFGPISIFAIVFHTNIPWGTLPIETRLLHASLPGVVYEEVLFRGTLWMFLSHLKLSERKILFVQAFLFWISHYYYYPKLYLFWIAIPIIGLILGIMVSRSKSLTPSTISHFVINILLSV